MKARIIAALLLVVMIASLFSACGLIEVDRKRDLKQVIAVVGDDEYKDEILKEDLANLFNQQGPNLMQQYGLSVKQTVEYLLERLINNRVLVQEAAKTIMQKRNLSGTLKDYLGKQGDGRSLNMKRLIGDEAYDKAASRAYKYEKELLDYYEEVIKKEENPDATPEPTPTPTPTPRPTRKPNTGADEPEETPYPPNLPIDDTEESRLKALERIKTDLRKNQDLTYEEFFENTLVSELENELLELYEKHLEEDIRVDFDAMETRLANMLEADKYQYAIDLESYGTKLQNAGADTLILYNPVSGYGYVKNLLISFSDAQKDKLAELQVREWSKEEYIRFREKLLDEIMVKNYEDEEADEIAILDFYQDFVSGTPEEFTLFAGTKNNELSKPEYDVYTTGKTGTDLEEMTDKFIDLIFKYGSDPGMFNNEIDYLVAPKNETGQEQYVIEFAKAARDVIAAGAGSYAMVGTDYGWHIILCTEVLFDSDILENNIKNVERTVYDAITAALEGDTPFDEIAGVKGTLTYKLYKLMREEIKGAVVNQTVEAAVENYKDKIVKYENRYKDYLQM